MASLRVQLVFGAVLLAVANAHPASTYSLKETGNEWWRSAPIYQIYPLSFRDKDNDGRGDLQGIIEKLPYLKELGIVSVWLSPIYPSPMVDFGYDISDFRGINEWYGTMDDFDQLIQSAHDLGLKILMDFVPNHSSDQHEWFQKSVNSEGNYTDYYVWRDPKGFDEDGNPMPPNNWLSIFRGHAWTYNEQRKQFYLHHFAPQQPDLNYRNPNVVQEMKDVILFWLKKGVDGFRIDAVPFLFEHPDLPDEPVHLPLGDDPLDAGYLDHIYTQNQPETFDMVQQWRELIDGQTAIDGIDRCFMVEAYADVANQMRYFGTPERPGANFPFNFNIIGTNNQSTAQELKRNIDAWFDNIPEGAQSNWVIGNHDQSRIGSKVGNDSIDGMNMIVTLLPGVSVTYYGEELGMVNNDDITYEEGVDPQGCNYPPEQFHSRSRDFERTPMQWDGTVNAGFNNGAKPWLPVNKNYVDVNVEAETGQEYSHYTIYRELREADKLPVVQSGRLLVEVVGKGTLGLLRSLGSNDFLVALINFTNEQEEINLDPVFLTGDRMLDVYTASANSGLQKKTQVSATNITLAPKGSVVLTIPKSE